MKERLRQFLQGRYGIDALNRFLIVLTFVFIILSVIFRYAIFTYLAYIALILYLLRMLSRNISARYNENAKYLQIKGKCTGKFRFWKQRWKDRKAYRYFSCPSCKAKMRVPKGRGKIIITCRCCGNQFERKS